MHRTTVLLDDELYRQAKKTAVDEDKSLKELVETALTRYLNQRHQTLPKKRPKFGVYRLRIKGDLRRETIYDWL
jgi:hypothetical protein